MISAREALKRSPGAATSPRVGRADDASRPASGIQHNGVDIDLMEVARGHLMFPTGYGRVASRTRAHRLSNLHRYVFDGDAAIHVNPPASSQQFAPVCFDSDSPYTCLCKLLRRSVVHMFMQIAETVVGPRRDPSISFTARLQACLKGVPATYPLCPAHSRTRRVLKCREGPLPDSCAAANLQQNVAGPARSGHDR
jgi:hypothetical protein